MNLSWTQRTPTDVTKLEEHRRAMQDSNYLGPLMRVEDLTPDEVSLINVSFFDRCQRERPEDITQIYDAYVRTLHQWGVMCPHPQPHRLYSGWMKSDGPVPFDESTWYDCGLCKAGVINR